MKSLSKIIAFIFGLIVFGSLAGVGFGYISNITTALSDAGYAWAGTIMVVGIIITGVYLFLPKRG